MRQIILDTETTGLDPKHGHRIIEIAGVELVDRRPTGRHVHFYVNPEREIDAGATDVHGLHLGHAARQAEVRRRRRRNSSTSRAARSGSSTTRRSTSPSSTRAQRAWACRRSAVIAADVVDTLALAREQFPGKRNSLDALCERFGVANAHRTLHGALLDAQLLAEVYLAMTRGQESLTIDIVDAAIGRPATASPPRPAAR